jgi:hypothetical protein
MAAAIRAAEMRLMLPTDATQSDELQAEHLALLARMN